LRSLTVRARYTCVVLASALVSGLITASADASGPSAAPALGTPAGTLVYVSTEQQLSAAVRSAETKTTIVIAPGVYRLASPLAVGNVADVVIRGATDRAADVILQGSGFLAGDSAPAAHAFVIGGQRITLANLTVRDFPSAAVVFDGRAASPRIYNVASVDNHGSILAGAGTQAVAGGRVEYSRFEYSSPVAAGSNAPAISVGGGAGWAVRHSLFKGLKSVDGNPVPALLLHSSATGAVIESNTFVSSAQEIVFGASQRGTADRTTGIIRNNFIARDAASSAAAAITLVSAPSTQVLHNTILMNGSYANAIELQSKATAGVRVQNNLLDAPVVRQRGATGTIEPNDSTATAAYFVNPAAGDLHLLPAATSAIDAAAAVSGVGNDWDGQSRGSGVVDYGADELSTSSTTPSTTTANADGGDMTTSNDTNASSDTTDAAQLTTLAAAVTATSTLPTPWATQDIGGPSIAGSASYSSGTYTVKGAGEGIAGTRDEFRFVYQPLSGDAEVVARIGTMTTANKWAKAGVMIRQSLTAGSAYAMANLSLKNGLTFQRRLSGGAGTKISSGGSGAVPQWVRIVRKGSSFSAYRSSNGTSWTLIGTDTVSMSGTVYVGLAVTSQRPGGSTTTGFTDVVVSAATAGDRLSTALPSPWVSRDIGSSRPAGSATYSSGTFTIKGGGADIWGTSDQFHFAYRTLNGDGEIVARVGSLQQTDIWAKAGVMVRASLYANASFAYALTSASQGVWFQKRNSSGASATSVNSTGGGAPVWLRLERKGNQFTASRSSDGANWSTIGSTWISMPTTVYVGLAATSHDTSTTTTATFNNVAVRTGSASNAAPTVSVTSPVSGQTFTAPATISVTANASDSDGTISKVEFYRGSTLIGTDSTAPYSASAGSLSAGTYTITAVAQDNAGARTTSGTVTITVSSTTTPTMPQTLTFTPSADHATLVTKYVFEVFTAGANPSTATPVRTQDLGKPSVSNNQISVNVGTTIQALSSGSYFSTVKAVGSAGWTRSAPSNTFSR